MLLKIINMLVLILQQIYGLGFLKSSLIKSINILSNSKYQLLDRRFTELLLNNHFNNKEDYMMILWKFYAVARWMEKWRF